jgi:hypothetical protein
MAQSDDTTPNLKRIVLPSGKTIEVVHFSRADESAPATPPQAPGRQRELHVCPECASELVYPTKWTEAGSEHWHVTLRCPSCEWTESDTFAQDLADRFDEELERGTDLLVRDLKRLTRANMAEEIDRFVQALDADGIQPMDF